MHRNKKQQPNPTQHKYVYGSVIIHYWKISLLLFLFYKSWEFQEAGRDSDSDSTQPPAWPCTAPAFKFQQHHLVPPGQIRRKILNMSTKPLSSFMESWDYCTVFCFFYCLLVNICHKNDLLPLEPNHWACHHFTFVVADITHSNLLENNNSIGI